MSAPTAKIVYFGGGGSRGPGTMESFIHHGPDGSDFDRCRITIYDVDPTNLDLVVRLSEKMAAAAGRRIEITGSTDLSTALDGCDFVLSSFRPGGFQMRSFDERIPLRHGLIGNETEGAGGFMMALRSVHVARRLTDAMAQVCPRAILVNYTNPVSIVSQAITANCGIRTYSLCEGSIASPPWYARIVGLDESKLCATMVGVNHGTWTVKATYDGQDFLPLLERAYEQRREQITDPIAHGLLRLAITLGSLPNYYYQWYYLERTWLSILQSKKTTRAEDLLEQLPGIFAHYREQLDAAGVPRLDALRSRGGLHELELALDLMAAILHNRRQRMPVNLPNQNAVAGLDRDLVVEVPAIVDGRGARPVPLDGLPSGMSPRHPYQLPDTVMPLLLHRARFQKLAADAAWKGTRRDAIAAMAAHPLVRDLDIAERVYDELCAAQANYLPERLLK